VPSYFDEQARTANLDGWSDADLQLLIDEGRREADSQSAAVLEVRGRAQWLFTGTLALVAALAASGSSVLGDTDAPTWARVFWYASLPLAGYGGLGAAAVITVRGDFGAISSWQLSQGTPPILGRVAKDYADMLGLGEDTVNTLISVYRQAVVWMLAGGACGLAAWIRVKVG
jgi:hypothetical protein